MGGPQKKKDVWLNSNFGEDSEQPREIKIQGRGKLVTWGGKREKWKYSLGGFASVWETRKWGNNAGNEEGERGVGRQNETRGGESAQVIKGRGIPHPAMTFK